MKDKDMGVFTAFRAIKSGLILVVGLSMACQTPPPTQSGSETAVPELSLGAEEAALSIDQATLAQHLGQLSSDEMEGRGPATAGDERARAYLIEALDSLGLEPGGPEGNWEQPFDMVGVDAKVPEVWTFRGDSSDTELRFREDFMASSGVQTETASIENAEVVFVGFGIQAPEYEWDDYKGIDVTGKVLLMLNNDPDWDDALFAGTRRLYYGRWTYKYETAARLGAVGAIVIHTTPSAGYPWQVVQSSWSGAQYQLPAGDEPRTQIEAWVTEDAASSLAGLAGHDLDELREAAKSRDFVPVPLGLHTSLKFQNSLSHVQTANVGGLLRGSDPDLAEEVVVYTAHHDHLGIGDPDSEGDSIYNGALDNASGCAQVLTVAQAFNQLSETPRRSILFLLVAAEEQGLLGSEHFAKNPTFPPGAIAANINLDNDKNMWGRTKDLTYIGYGKSSLDRVVDEAAARQGRTVKPDQFPDRGFFYRSDQFNLAKIGVPAIYLKTGTEFIGRPEGWGAEQIEAWEATRYHQPSDEYDDSWNFDGLIDNTRVAFEVGLAIAQADEMPSWNPGDEFEAARLEALAALE